MRLTTMAMMAFNVATSLLCVSTAGREAGSAEPALAFLEKESAERPFGPQPGQGSPTLGAKKSGWAKPYQADKQHRTKITMMTTGE
jgi:hypothetical protein